MLTTFDPDRGAGNFQGHFTKVNVIDPAAPGHTPNLVLDPSKPYEIEVEWALDGTDVPLYISALDDKWNIQVFAESMGPGPELKIAEDNSLAKGAPGVNVTYSKTVTIPAGVLQEGNPGQDVSGVYKLTVAVFLNSSLGAPGFDIAGFAEGPIIRVENPL